MARRIITTEEITNTYEIATNIKSFEVNEKSSENEIGVNKSIPQNIKSKEVKQNFTGQPSSNKTQVKYTSNIIEKSSNNNLDSSLQQNNQSMSSTGKWRTDTSKSYGTNKSITNTGYCTCDDTKDSISHKRYTDKTFNKTTISSNDQNIFIQEGNNSDYCKCDETEKKIFSKTTSDYNANVRNEIPYEDMNMCSCGQQSTIESIESKEYRNKDIMNNITVDKDIEIVRKKIREQIKRELNEETENEEALWSGENYIQVIERLQILTEEPPELRVQFINDLMINRTVNREPINVLIPIPDNYIQKQGVLQVLSEQKEKKEEEEKDLYQELCPENVDLLNVSSAYSTAVPSFNNLEIENVEMYIKGTPKIEEKKDLSIEPFVIENYAWDISPSERTWTGDMRAVRINKFNIEKNKPDWNNLIEKELVNKFNVEAEKVQKAEKKLRKKKKIEQKKETEKVKEEESQEEVEEIEEIEEEDKEEEERIRKIKEQKELKKRRKDQKNIITEKFSLTFKENKKQFKKIYIGDNEIITLKAIKRVLQPTKPKKELQQSEKNDFILGGSGFDINKYKWAPVPVNAQTMTIENKKIAKPFENVPTDKLEVPAARRRRQDWNLVNNLSSESVINILTEEKKLEEEKISPITVLGEVGDKKNKWNDKISKNKGVKLSFAPTKKWPLKICKEIDIMYEQDTDDVIINDDYNNVKGMEMRPITATILKVTEEDDTSSVSSYDVFQNIILHQQIFEENKNVKKFRNLFENEQKNRNDKKPMNFHINNLNRNNRDERKKFEYLRQDKN